MNGKKILQSHTSFFRYFLCFKYNSKWKTWNNFFLKREKNEIVLNKFEWIKKISITSTVIIIFLCFIERDGGETKITWTAQNNDKHKTDYGIWRMGRIYMCSVESIISLKKLSIQHGEHTTAGSSLPKWQSYVRMRGNGNEKERNINQAFHTRCMLFSPAQQPETVWLFISRWRI